MESNTVNTSLEISENSKEFLMESAKWARFLAIVSFVGLGIIVLVGVLFLFSIIPMTSSNSEAAQFMPPIVGVLYLLMAVLYFFPTMYLYRFATSIQKALSESESNSLELGFENLKSLFRFIGILTIIVLSFYVLTILLMVVAVILK
jgi:hypothetical protein